MEGSWYVSLGGSLDGARADLRERLGAVGRDPVPHHSVGEEHDDVHRPLAAFLNDLGLHAKRAFLSHQGDHWSPPRKAGSALISPSTWFMPSRTGGVSSPPGVKSAASIR